jgi:hypothetical protein
LPLTDLDETNSRRYRPRAQHRKHALIRWEATQYVLEWGTQVFSGPHVVVRDPKGEYGVELAVFFATHRPVAETPDHYVKVVAVRAVVVRAEVALTTRVQGKREMTAHVPAGAFLVQNESGERYAMSRDEFDERYELDE